MSPLRLDRLLSNLGYCSRREAKSLVNSGRVRLSDGSIPRHDDRVLHEAVRLDSAPLDPAQLFILMNKPIGFSCSHREAGKTIYELLPERYLQRTPSLTSVGRLDKETSGVLILTDSGALVHRVTSPRTVVTKVYEARLDRPVRGNEEALFASGALMLEGETEPLLPAALRVLEPTLARISLIEGRYHQVRRMWAAAGNHVISLERIAIGALTCGGLAQGEWRALNERELSLLFEPPSQ